MKPSLFPCLRRTFFFLSKYGNKGTEALRLSAVIDMFECVYVVVIIEG